MFRTVDKFLVFVFYAGAYPGSKVRGNMDQTGGIFWRAKKTHLVTSTQHSFFWRTKQKFSQLPNSIFTLLARKKKSSPLVP